MNAESAPGKGALEVAGDDDKPSLAPTTPLAAAQRGMYVHPVDHPSLPVCAGIRTLSHDPATCTERGKHPCIKWSEESTTDVQLVTAEFAGRARNIGIDCGKSGLLVIDEDKPGALQRYAQQHGHMIPATYTVATGKGRHYYFRQNGTKFGNTPGAFKGLGIDVRGHGGYVVAAGSTHQTGAVYTAENQLDPAPLPTWIIDAVQGDAGQLTTVAPPFELPEKIAAGNLDGGLGRDETLWRYACSLRGKGVTVTRAALAMQEAWKRCEQPPGDLYPIKAALEKIDRAWGYDYTSPNGTTPTSARTISDELPPLVRLDEFLATPDEDLVYRVDKLWPFGGRVVLAAAWKAGKTTLLGNLIRALVDDQPFLGRYQVQPARRVVLIDDELDQRTLRRWLREQNITNTARVELVALRGKVSTFNIIDDAVRTRWARHIGPGDVLLFDCLRPVLDALGLDESHDTGKFLVHFDALLAEAGIGEAAIAQHMGHVGERSRGDSRLRDWPDAEWKLVREDPDDADSPRYFSAYGRDVDQPEQLLGYDSASRRLTVTGGSRKDARAEARIDAVVEYVTDNPGCSQDQLERAVGGRAADVRTARDRAVERGRITAGKVGKRKEHHPCSSTRPNSSGRVDEDLSSPRPLVLYEDEDEDVPGGQLAEINRRDEDEQTDLDEEIS